MDFCDYHFAQPTTQTQEVAPILPRVLDGNVHPDLNTIETKTVAELVQGKFKDQVSRFFIIDCRYPYEFEGGHILGAVNVVGQDLLQKFFPSVCAHQSALVQNNLSTRVVIVFHCEFSSQRAPQCYRQLRAHDRTKNSHHYPYLCFPDIYLMEGGYRKFYKEYESLCEGGIVYMKDKKHIKEMRKYESMRRSLSFPAPSTTSPTFGIFSITEDLSVQSLIVLDTPPKSDCTHQNKKENVTTTPPSAMASLPQNTNTTQSAPPSRRLWRSSLEIDFTKSIPLSYKLLPSKNQPLSLHNTDLENNENIPPLFKTPVKCHETTSLTTRIDTPTAHTSMNSFPHTLLHTHPTAQTKKDPTSPEKSSPSSLARSNSQPNTISISPTLSISPKRRRLQKSNTINITSARRSLF